MKHPEPPKTALVLGPSCPEIDTLERAFSAFGHGVRVVQATNRGARVTAESAAHAAAPETEEDELVLAVGCSWAGMDGKTVAIAGPDYLEATWAVLRGARVVTIGMPFEVRDLYGARPVTRAMAA